MKTYLALIVVLLALTACTASQSQVVEPTATSTPLANMPNPASVYCEQQGYRLEIRTAADGSQTGICWFADGSSCDEWAYYRGECGPAPRPSATPGIAAEATVPADGGTAQATPASSLPSGTAEKVEGWWGVIVSTPAGAQFDDSFERWDLAKVITYGIDSLDPAARAQIVALRDTGRIVYLYGTLLSDVPDVNGSQVQVDRIEISEPIGGYMRPGTAENIADWWGVIRSTPPGAQFDDSFERRDLGQVILFGIDSLDPAVQAQIVALRDSGLIVHLWGTLLSVVPDVNGSQVRVDRIAVEE